MGSGEKSTFQVLRCPSGRCLQVKAAASLPDDIPEDTYLVAEIMEQTAQRQLLALEEKLGGRLLVPEVWQNVLQKAGILIPSSLSGGTLTDRLTEAYRAVPGRCWLYLEPLRMRFPLPCPSGAGTTLPRDTLDRLTADKPSFYTPELCCRYCYDLPDGIVLYDTEDTWQDKLHLAQSIGLSGAVMPTWDES